MELHEAPSLFERIINYDPVKEIQVRLVVSTFRSVEYLSLRKYYLDFEEEWKPSKEGITIPLTFDNSKELFIGLVEILSLAETKELLNQGFKELLDEIYI